MSQCTNLTNETVSKDYCSIFMIEPLHISHLGILEEINKMSGDLFVVSDKEKRVLFFKRGIVKS